MQERTHDIITGLISRLTGAMGIACQVQISGPEADGVLSVHIRTEEDANLLIGKSGQNLAALEHVLRAVCHRGGDARRVVVDVNDYRKALAQELVQMVRQVVARVRDTGRSQALLPMMPHERRIVHMELASYTDVTSESVGEESNRRVVIKPLSF